jgi:ribose transport system permease protein
VLVAYVRLPSFLVTLATMGLFAGVARSLTNLRSIPVTDSTSPASSGPVRCSAFPR